MHDSDTERSIRCKRAEFKSIALCSFDQ